jgi:hypothetical protein
MRKLFWAFLISLAAALPAVADQSAAAPAAATKGDMLHSADGSRLGEVDRVGSDGSVQLIFDGKVVTVPGATLSMQGGELTTSLKKNEVMNLK